MTAEIIRRTDFKHVLELGLLLLFGTFHLDAFAESDSADNVPLLERLEMEGTIDLGLSYGERGYRFFYGGNDIWESEYERHLEVEVDFEIGITEKIWVEFDIEGEFSNPGPKLQKGLLLFDLPDKQVLRLGNMKRRLGLEERTGRSERLIPGRSVLHSYFSTFGFMGYNFAAEYRKKWDLLNGDDIKTWIQLGGDADLRFFGEVAAGLSWDHAKTGFGLFYMEHLEVNRENCYIGGINTVWEKRGTEVGFELHAGKDPWASYYSALLDSGADIHFLGSRFQISHLFNIGNIVVGDLQPVLSVAHVIPDIRTFREAVVEFYPAISIYIGSSGRVRWISGLSAVCTVNEPRGGALHLKEHRVNTSLQAIW